MLSLAVPADRDDEFVPHQYVSKFARSAAVAAVDLAFEVAGSTANELDSPLQRFARDVRAATQHIAVVPNNFEIAGRVLVGLEPGTPRF